MKTKLNLASVNGGSFNCLPAREVEIENERILCNDIRFPWESHPYNLALWVIGNEFGAVCAVWAEHEQGALDCMIDENLGDSFLVSSEDYEKMEQAEKDDCACLGNAGEPCNLDYAWMQKVEFKGERDFKLIAKFAEARGAQAENLDKI